MGALEMQWAGCSGGGTAGSEAPSACLLCLLGACAGWREWPWMCTRTRDPSSLKIIQITPTRALPCLPACPLAAVSPQLLSCYERACACPLTSPPARTPVLLQGADEVLGPRVPGAGPHAQCADHPSLRLPHPGGEGLGGPRGGEGRLFDAPCFRSHRFGAT